MSEFIKIQSQVFLVAIGTGIVIGLFYDCIRIFRRIIKHSNFVINIEDMLFWIISSMILFITLFKQNNGIIRGYIIIGVIIGLMTYFSLFSKMLVTYVAKLINFILSILKKIITILFRPFTTILRFIFGYLKVFFSLLKKVFKAIHKQLKKTQKTVKILVKKI
ncbi:spore cortex biosynthesis protein YabQ [Natranaerovirga hydrolytica]|uniref:Spore cortex biosynthesis protein YabQ n=1 Tax=Natranaerovirga hydrolytica TaxID=680378 RepID=A0A4R1M921_9FIRM|nr:spore cortex biosynthesis protein YabQ [Natranaerovirga hydrolytica]TCK87860.1 spore cortex biosynthesis protein YabQ [Natranaerovirga hydrolytica]